MLRSFILKKLSLELKNGFYVNLKKSKLPNGDSRIAYYYFISKSSTAIQVGRGFSEGQSSTGPRPL
jgi:hypothetical protein